ncbi:hypothetical protein Q7I34_09985, partial [Aeromonas veronii]|uniref:hypothetical protein n=1 Tax=Aeromonas veronii TaxID=654 RepID=UPI003006EA56
EPAGMTTIGLSYSLVKISTKCAPALPLAASQAAHTTPTIPGRGKKSVQTRNFARCILAVDAASP